jgi:hypothetical protein
MPSDPEFKTVPPPPKFYPLWTSATFSVSLFVHGSTTETGDQPAARPLPTHIATETQYTHTDNHAPTGIRTHDRSVREGEDGSCLCAVTVMGYFINYVTKHSVFYRVRACLNCRYRTVESVTDNRSRTYGEHRFSFPENSKLSMLALQELNFF